MRHFFTFLALIFTLFSHSIFAIDNARSIDHSAFLKSIIETYTQASKKLDPYSAPYFNLEEDLDKFGDYPSAAYFERAKSIDQQAYTELQKINLDKLQASEWRTYKLFEQNLRLSLESYKYPIRYLSFNQMGNRLSSYLDDSSESLTMFPFDSVKHYEAFIRRSEGFPTYIENQIALLKDGIKEKIVLSKIVAHQIPNTYKDGLESVVEKHPFWRPILFMPKTFSVHDQERLKTAFRKMIVERIQPGFKKFDEFFRSEYQVQCRENFGLVGLPQAASWYSHTIESNTSLKLKPEVIHQIGLKEVQRIVSEMEGIKKQLGFKGSYQEFTQSLLKDERYFFKNAQDMFLALTQVKDKVNAKIHEYFLLTPKSEVKLVESSNPEDAAGRYNEPTEMLPYGRFVVNTKNLRAIPIYGVSSLMIHETIPGHHFQLALAYEMKDKLSEYQRKLFQSTAFVEGWALYSEYLGNEMGMYKDPLQRLGHLNDELLRALRLVVDTGIHHYSWSQKQSIAYMQKYLASDIGDITNEVNRYSVWPGQALSYKIGQLKIIELRKWAEKELGVRFNLPEFHRSVIGEGTVSLEVLETQVQNWVAKRRLTGMTLP